MTGEQSPDRALSLAVLISGRGRGTNFQAILDACTSGVLPARVSVLISTSRDAPAMSRASDAGVDAVYLASDPHDAEGSQMDGALLTLLTRYQVDLVCLAGFMRKVGPIVLQHYRNRIMNVHPSLIPSFAGQGMYGRRVHNAVLQYGVKLTGCTVQFVDEEYDSGPIILQRVVAVEEDDTPETLAARVLAEEHAGYVEAIGLFARGLLQVSGRRVRVLSR